MASSSGEELAGAAEEKKVQRETYYRRDSNGYTAILHGHRYCCVEVQLYGAQVISWKNLYGEELLFVSSEARYDPPNPLAGGISICFPKVSEHGQVNLQELARCRHWKIDDSPPPLPTCSSLTKSYVDLILKPKERDLRIWPHKFECRLHVALGHAGDLTMISRVKNMNTNHADSFTFKFSYRNYFRVSHIRDTRVEGLGALLYHIDNAEGGALILDQVDKITFKSEVDKKFHRTPSKICVMDEGNKNAVIIRKEGLPDVCVWNPGKKEDKLEGDIGKDEYEEAVCIEPAAAEAEITLNPAEEWMATQEISYVPPHHFKH